MTGIMHFCHAVGKKRASHQVKCVPLLKISKRFRLARWKRENQIFDRLEIADLDPLNSFGSGVVNSLFLLLSTEYVTHRLARFVKLPEVVCLCRAETNLRFSRSLASPEAPVAAKDDRA